MGPLRNQELEPGEQRGGPPEGPGENKGEGPCKTPGIKACSCLHLNLSGLQVTGIPQWCNEHIGPKCVSSYCAILRLCDCTSSVPDATREPTLAMVQMDHSM